MHSQDFEYTEEDIKYADDPKTRVVSFNYNSDLSGEVIISNEISVIRIPGWMLVNFVGYHIQSELIEKLENMSGKETLEFLQGV